MTADEVLRTCVTVLVMATIVGWSTSIRMHKSVWLGAGDVRAFLVSLAILPVLIVNGLGIIYAMTKGLPVTWLTYAYAGSYIALNAALWVPLPKRR